MIGLVFLATATALAVALGIVSEYYDAATARAFYVLAIAGAFFVCVFAIAACARAGSVAAAPGPPAPPPRVYDVPPCNFPFPSICIVRGNR